MMKKKEGFNSWASKITPPVTLTYTNLSNGTYTPGPGAMGLANYAQGGSLMLESDASGNLSTSASLPVGAIIIWFGPWNSIPVGWALCDGNNGTPDLYSGKFPQGVGDDATLGATGGQGRAELPYHNHLVMVGASNTSLNTINVADTDTNYVFSSDHLVATPTQMFKGVQTTNSGTGNTAPIPTIPPYVGVYYIMKMQ